jgi:ABC-type Fe3+ transport system substrate-binding protein
MISQLMAVGEFPLGIVYAHRVESMKKSGAPIEWVKTADPVFVTLSPVAVAAKARNPNAAKLLMDFVFSREAQPVLRNASAHPGWMSNLWCRDASWQVKDRRDRSDRRGRIVQIQQRVS